MQPSTVLPYLPGVLVADRLSQQGITNARFVTGKAEEVLLGLLEEYHSFPSVAVLDPPRSGARKPFISIFSCLSASLILFNVPFQTRMS